MALLAARSCLHRQRLNRLFSVGLAPTPIEVPLPQGLSPVTVPVAELSPVVASLPAVPAEAPLSLSLSPLGLPPVTGLPPAEVPILGPVAEVPIQLPTLGSGKP